MQLCSICGFEVDQGPLVRDICIRCEAKVVEEELAKFELLWAGVPDGQRNAAASEGDKK
jgi:hypothetical protein